MHFISTPEELMPEVIANDKMIKISEKGKMRNDVISKREVEKFCCINNR